MVATVDHSESKYLASKIVKGYGEGQESTRYMLYIC